MGAHLRERLGILVVIGIDRVLALLCRLGGKHAALTQIGAEHLAVFGGVGNILGNNVSRARQSGGGIGNAVFLANVCRGKLLKRSVQRIGLSRDQLGERLETSFSCHRRARFALRAIGEVKVLQLHERGRAVDRRLKLVRHLLLRGDRGGNLLAALVKVAQIGQSILKATKRIVVHASRHFLAVAGNEGNGISLVQHLHRFFNVFLGEGKLLR